MRQSASEKARIRRLRAKYRKRIWIVGIILLIIGFALGILADRKFFNQSDAVQTASVLPETTQAPEATAVPEGDDDGQMGLDGELTGTEGEEDDYIVGLPTPTPEPTPEPTPTPVPEPTVIAVVPFGESYTYTTQIKADGSARIDTEGDEAYETISFTQTMQTYMRPTDFANKYASQYKLQGNEAGAGFELVLNDYTGSATIVPQNVIKINFESESGNATELGYQLMDAEIAGNYGIAVTTNTPKTLYKRYQFSNSGEEMKYLVVSTYNDGAIQKILFELESDVVPSPSPAATYPVLQKGSKSDAVLDLQTRLIELGYLEGGADGDFGSKTETAIKKAQAAFGMQETGVADNEFQQRLFADQSN